MAVAVLLCLRYCFSFGNVCVKSQNQTVQETQQNLDVKMSGFEGTLEIIRSRAQQGFPLKDREQIGFGYHIWSLTHVTAI